MLHVIKRGSGCQQDQEKDEQAFSESSLNKLVGAVDTYDLEVKALNLLFPGSKEYIAPNLIFSIFP
jgi:hypothetical protein